MGKSDEGDAPSQYLPSVCLACEVIWVKVQLLLDSRVRCDDVEVLRLAQDCFVYFDTYEPAWIGYREVKPSLTRRLSCIRGISGYYPTDCSNYVTRHTESVFKKQSTKAR